MAVIYLKTTTQTVSPITYISLKLKRVLRFSELFRNDLLFIVKLDNKKAHGLLVPALQEVGLLFKNLLLVTVV